MAQWTWLKVCLHVVASSIFNTLAPIGKFSLYSFIHIIISCAGQQYISCAELIHACVQNNIDTPLFAPYSSSQKFKYIVRVNLESLRRFEFLKNEADGPKTE